MDWYTYLYGAGVAGGAAFGLYAARNSFSSLRETTRLFKAIKTPAVAGDGEWDETDNQKKAATYLKGVPRRTNCLAIVGDGAVRLKSGGFMRGFRVESKPTLYRDDAEVDRLYNDLAVMLTTNLPTGSALQWRLAVYNDLGELLEDQELRLIESEGIHSIAQTVKLQDIQYQKSFGRRGHFLKSVLTLWVYIPVKHEADNLNNPFTLFLRRTKSEGWSSLKNLSKDEQVVERLIKDEAEAFERAEKYYALIEAITPVRLTRFSHEETAQALYFSHNENAKTAPMIPRSPYTDLRAYLGGESIRQNNTWYVLHGNTPVCLITMFVPPESNSESEGCKAGMMRILSENPALSFRHTVVTEFIKLDKTKMEKELKNRLKRLKFTSTKPSGEVKFDEKKERIYHEIKSVQQQNTSSGKEVIQMRFYILCYGAPASTQSELAASVKELEKNCDELLSYIRRAMPGADASREEPAAIRALYERTLIGELETAPTEREIEEQADSLCAFIPAETTWTGMPQSPHSIFPTTTGKLLPLNLFRNHLSSAPIIPVFGEAGSGKSVLMQQIIADILGSIPYAKAKACDYGESMRPLVEMFGGRHLRFSIGEVRALNIWDYPGLEDGEKPDEIQSNFVVEDTLILLRINAETEKGKLQESVLRKCVKEVYDDEIPRNRKGVRRHEPTLSHLVNKLRYRHFENESSETIARELSELLEDYIKHPWLDAPTHESYRDESRFDVFELSSLAHFPKDIRRSMAYRVGARVNRSIGEKHGGISHPLVIVLDECHEYVKNPDFAVVLKAMEKAAEHGRKENVISLLGTHTFANIKHLPGIVSNFGGVIVGRQENFADLKENRNWNDQVEAAVRSIHNVKGSHSQFVVAFGTGKTQQVEKIQVSLSPLHLWAFSTDPVERNARARVQQLFPHWETAQVVSWLAERYPHGLALIGKNEIDEQYIRLEQMIEASNATFAPEHAVFTPEAEAPELRDNHKPLLLGASYSEREIEDYDAETGEGNVIEGELCDVLIEGMVGFFGEDIDEQAKLEKQKARAFELGIDIPGVIVVDAIEIEEEESEIYEVNQR
jgi:hypothetical protein